MKQIICLFILMASATGCSSFNSQWKNAPASIPSSARDITGKWEGTWKSDANAHSDKLRCLITQESENVYEAYFHAKYKKIFSFSYKMRMETKPGTDPVQFEGAADLGKLAGGRYTYSGSASSTRFDCSYSSKYDHGTFQMARP
jgi:hypothetical protein